MSKKSGRIVVSNKPELQVKIIDPNKVVFEGSTEYIIAPGVKSDLGIFPNHTPLYAELKAGDIVLHGEKESSFTIESGIIKVQDDVVTILVIAPKVEVKKEENKD